MQFSIIYSLSLSNSTSNSSQIVFWILLVLFLELSHVSVLSTLEVGAFTTDPEVESQFVQFHGNDPEKSGNWSRMHDIRYDIHKLKNISTQIHTKVFNRSEHVTTAVVARRQLQFRSSPQYKSMDIDIVRYTIHQFLLRPEDKVLLFHFTKGLGPDSVHYLEANDTGDIKVVYLSHLVRGIDLYPNC